MIGEGRTMAGEAMEHATSER